MSYQNFNNHSFGLNKYCPYPPTHITKPTLSNDTPFNPQFIEDKPITPPAKPLPHGGLYSEPEPKERQPWHAISVMAESSYMINTNLLSANPPPGANVQYIGTNRPGNNTVNMEGVYKYDPKNKEGMYNINLVME